MVLQRFIGLPHHFLQFHSTYVKKQSQNFVTSKGNSINVKFVLFYETH
jgi:hypothetical protein